MGSLGGEVAKKKKAMWLYPKVIGVGPSERWGHSSCYSNGLLYIFGGCYGGMHFSDVLVLNLEKMDWSVLVTKGQGPGPRDSHCAAIVGNKMIVFGGTNGSEKVNDVHILDLRSKEWTRPECKGTPPSPRESHTATLIGDGKLVVFGGSGEGESNYLNDLHVLDLKTMRWTTPETKGNAPVPRDSHSAVTIGNRLFLYGGDSGDRYQGDVEVLDMETLTWSRMNVHGPSPGVRAGHASVNFGTKMYVIGGVAHKQYYNDVWVLDVVCCSWTRLDVCGQKPQGRFSHSAVVTNSDITIYGGCGEDERPLNELLILQLGGEQINTVYKTPLSRTTDQEVELINIREKKPFSHDRDAFNLKLKRSRMNNSRIFYSDQSNLELEHSLSLSQNSSSPSQSEQEQTTAAPPPPKVFPIVKPNSNPKIIVPTRTRLDLHPPVNICKPDQVHFPGADEPRSLEGGQFQNLIGAEVRGTVDGAFDSGYLMTATINGKTFRGVLFAPGPVLVSREVNLGQRPPMNRTNHAGVNPVNACLNQYSSLGVRQQQPHPLPTKLHYSPEIQLAQVRRSNAAIPAARWSPPASSSMDRNHKKNELLGVVLSLGGPGGNGDGKL